MLVAVAVVLAVWDAVVTGVASGVPKAVARDVKVIYGGGIRSVSTNLVGGHMCGDCLC